MTNFYQGNEQRSSSVRSGDPTRDRQADLFTGAGGYHFKGQSYGQSTHEQKLSCVDCHMVNVTDNSNVPDHSFNPKPLGLQAAATRLRRRSTSCGSSRRFRSGA